MVSIKWPLVLLILLVVCSAQKRTCKNLVKVNKLVQDQEWKCMYPDGQLIFTGHFTLNQDINVQDLMVIAVMSKLDSKRKSKILFETQYDFCNQNKLQWEGRWDRVKDYSDIPHTLCKQSFILQKGKTYHINNWPILTRNRLYIPNGWYNTNVIIAIKPKEKMEEKRKEIRFEFNSGENKRHSKHKKGKKGKKLKQRTYNKEPATYTDIDESKILFNVKFTYPENYRTKFTRVIVPKKTK